MANYRKINFGSVNGDPYLERIVDDDEAAQPFQSALNARERPGRDELGMQINFQHGNGFLTTGRDTWEYQKAHKGFRLTPEKHTIEIGTGMGEPIVELAKQCRKKAAAACPVVIDIVNYPKLLEMLEFAHSFSEHRGTRKRLKKMIERMRIILDANYINLMNCTLSEALEAHPSLKGSGEIVIDNIASGSYLHAEGAPDNCVDENPATKIVHDELNTKRLSLLKPGGTLYYK